MKKLFILVLIALLSCSAIPADNYSVIQVNTQQIIIEIVDWNMDLYPDFAISLFGCGIDRTKIIDIEAIIYSDSGTYITKIDQASSDMLRVDGKIRIIGDSLSLFRSASGVYDSTSYDQTGGFVRGYAVVTIRL